jgi:hypothetical protein
MPRQRCTRTHRDHPSETPSAWHTRRPTPRPIAKRFSLTAGGCGASPLPPDTRRTRPRPRRGRRGNAHDVRCGVNVARQRIGIIHRKRLRRWSRWSFHPGVSTKRRHPRLSTNTPSAWRTRRLTPNPIAKRFPNVAGGCGVSPLPPVTRRTRSRPRRGRRGIAHDVRCGVNVASQRIRIIPRKRLRRWSRWSFHPGVSAKRRHPRLSTNTPSARRTRRPTPRPIAKRFS